MDGPPGATGDIRFLLLVLKDFRASLWLNSLAHLGPFSGLLDTDLSGVKACKVTLVLPMQYEQ